MYRDSQVASRRALLSGGVTVSYIINAASPTAAAVFVARLSAPPMTMYDFITTGVVGVQGLTIVAVATAMTKQFSPPPALQVPSPPRRASASIALAIGLVRATMPIAPHYP